MHTLAWLAWLSAGFAAITLAPNPLYLCLVLLAAMQVFLACRGDSPLARSFGLFARAGALVFLGYLIFAVITVGGARGATALLTLPGLRLPDWLGGVVLGGSVTAEALAWGATRGLSIWALMTLFGAFNALVDHYRLLRLAPRSLFHAGLAVTIAVAFVPGLVRSSAEIVVAQRARGHRFGRPRSWLALVAPLLAGSLEKSLQLAEALDARGYGRTAAPDADLSRRQVGVLAGLLLLGAGLFGGLYYGPPAALPAGLALGAGALALGLSLRSLGRLVARSTYRRERWRRRDSLAVAAACAGVLALAAMRALGAGDLVYYPFPTIRAPGFDLRAGLALLLLAAPALLVPAAPSERPRRRIARRRADPRAREEGRGSKKARYV
jgi:energy-coupling factor transport system permease protein